MEEQKQEQPPKKDPSGGPITGNMLGVGERVILEPLPPRDPPLDPRGNY